MLPNQYLIDWPDGLIVLYVYLLQQMVTKSHIYNLYAFKRTEQVRSKKYKNNNMH